MKLYTKLNYFVKDILIQDLIKLFYTLLEWNRMI